MLLETEAKTRTCKDCQKDRPTTKFPLIREGGESVRRPVCHYCFYDGYTADQKHKIIREAYRNYLTFEYLVAIGEIQDVISYNVPVSKGSEEYVSVSISFSDLQRALNKYKDGLREEGTVLSERKEQAFYLNVIRDMLQRDVADIMGITTVSVGQYVEQGMMQLCDYYFAEENNPTDT